jgi:hypothetical protein
MTFIKGAQELLVYFDPWLALYVIPTAFTLGIALIPFLSEPTHNRQSVASSFNILFVLTVMEAVWLLLVAIGVLFRGPNWNFHWPWDEWVPRITAMNHATFSERCWELLSHERGHEITWIVQEFPALTFLVGFSLSSLLFACLLFVRSQQLIPYWRCLMLTLIIQLAALVPIKMCLFWMFNIKYIICLPDHGLNV